MFFLITSLLCLCYDRSLCEARDSAFAERDRAITAERGLGSKHDQLVKE